MNVIIHELNSAPPGAKINKAVAGNHPSVGRTADRISDPPRRLLTGLPPAFDWSLDRLSAAPAQKGFTTIFAARTSRSPS
jgi:hypothetical protein